MEVIQPQVYIALGVIIASIITGFFSFVNLINSKDQKISEFRQDWINELRKDIAKYCTQATILATKISNFLKDDRRTFADFMKEHKEENFDLFNCRNLIHLRLNPDKDNIVIDQVNAIYNLFSEGKFNQNDVFQKCDRLTELSQKLLKNEWKRVKRGEWTYFISKWGVFVFFIGIIVFAYQYLENIF